jgi:hypothetical protein
MVTIGFTSCLCTVRATYVGILGEEKADEPPTLAMAKGNSYVAVRSTQHITMLKQMNMQYLYSNTSGGYALVLPSFSFDSHIAAQRF